MNFFRNLFGRKPEATHHANGLCYASSKEHVILTIPTNEGGACEIQLLPHQARDMAARLMKIAEHVENQ